MLLKNERGRGRHKEFGSAIGYNNYKDEIKEQKQGDTKSKILVKDRTEIVKICAYEKKSQSEK